MLLTRVITALIGIPLTTYLIWQGGGILLVAISIIILLAQQEIIKILNLEKKYPLSLLIFIFGLVLILQTYFYNDKYLEFILFAFILFLSMIAILGNTSFEDITYSVFAYIYIPFLLRYLILLRFQEQGFFLVLTVFLLTWASDTGAFFVGKRFGKRKLSPEISPNKTIEGSIGGILFTSVISMLLVFFWFEKGLFLGFTLGCIISIVGQTGDLLESLIKRKFGVKDSGEILPGHGGILDRFDSLLLTAPVFYYILRLLIY